MYVYTLRLLPVKLLARVAYVSPRSHVDEFVYAHTLSGYCQVMTTMVRIDMDGGERKSMAIARRLRGALAERGISVAEIARRIGVTQQKLSRRMTGLNSFDVDELDAICRAAGVPFDYIATGIKELPPPPGGGAPRAPIPEDWSLLSGTIRRPLAYLVPALPAGTLPDDAAKPAAA